MNAIVQHSSESVEWYTPPAILDAARDLMGGIDLDPASCALANRHVRAVAYIDERHDGLGARWAGRVWLNPPGGVIDCDGRPVIKASAKLGRRPCHETGACGLPPGHAHAGVRSSALAWWEKLCDEYVAGRVEQALFLGFNSEILRSTQASRLPALAFPLCYPRQRIAFLREIDGKLVPGAQPGHDSVIVWLPPRRPARPEHESTWARSRRLLREDEDVARLRQCFGRIGCIGWCR